MPDQYLLIFMQLLTQLRPMFTHFPAGAGDANTNQTNAYSSSYPLHVIQTWLRLMLSYFSTVTGENNAT